MTSVFTCQYRWWMCHAAQIILPTAAEARIQSPGKDMSGARAELKHHWNPILAQYCEISFNSIHTEDDRSIVRTDVSLRNQKGLSL